MKRVSIPFLVVILLSIVMVISPVSQVAAFLDIESHNTEIAAEISTQVLTETDMPTGGSLINTPSTIDDSQIKTSTPLITGTQEPTNTESVSPSETNVFPVSTDINLPLPINTFEAMGTLELDSIIFPIATPTIFPSASQEIDLPKNQEKDAQAGLSNLENPALLSASTLSYPHLGMWWPNLAHQPLSKIATYDWVILAEEDRAFVPTLKRLNPRLMVLNSTNACELSYNPDPGVDPAENAGVRAIPAEWFLTQVGAQLTSDVDSVTTILPVDRISISDGTNNIALFIPGDTVVIEGESIYVQSVDKNSKTITVQRGYVRPASSHMSGTRIAAHITFWPNSWLLNLSTLSPQATVDPVIGAETWINYNARAAVQLITDSVWDGILIDRSDPNESWLIDNSTARTIDPDQSNRLLTDYSGFDRSWNQGLRQYESLIRQKIGNNRIIFVNWGMPNFDLLNGNNFEGFPRTDSTSYGASWAETVFGPYPNSGSYFQWMASSRQPNLTMIETYQDDGGPDPNGDGSYDNPYDHPGFIPNYRKMRFGLTTALLNNGYFSYEINTNGHGSLGLMWFDEYDNAGKNRRYLGQPLSAARGIAPALMTPNLVRGGGMNSRADLALWDIWADTDAGYSAAAMLEGGTVRIPIYRANGENWRVSFSYEPLGLTKNKEYTITFRARADRSRFISIWAQHNIDPWNIWLDFGDAYLTTSWRTYSFSAKSLGSDARATLQFNLGKTVGTVWLDDIRVQAGSTQIYRRDYSGGIVLVNATANARTIPLGGTFRKIKGRQVPSINNGALVNVVTLSAYDGLILLRP